MGEQVWSLFGRPDPPRKKQGSDPESEGGLCHWLFSQGPFKRQLYNLQIRTGKANTIIKEQVNIESFIILSGVGRSFITPTASEQYTTREENSGSYLSSEDTEMGGSETAETAQFQRSARSNGMTLTADGSGDKDDDGSGTLGVDVSMDFPNLEGDGQNSSGVKDTDDIGISISKYEAGNDNGSGDVDLGEDEYEGREEDDGGDEYEGGEEDYSGDGSEVGEEYEGGDEDLAGDEYEGGDGSGIGEEDETGDEDVSGEKGDGEDEDVSGSGAFDKLVYPEGVYY